MDAMKEDEGGKKEQAIELYLQAAEICIESVSYLSSMAVLAVLPMILLLLLQYHQVNIKANWVKTLVYLFTFSRISKSFTLQWLPSMKK